MSKITKEEYGAAVSELLKLAQRDTGGSRVAAQLLLSAYNGDDYQLDVSDLRNLDPNNFNLALLVIVGRYAIGEPHNVIPDGDKIFKALWQQWKRLHVSERHKLSCPRCYGRGRQYKNDDDETGTPCARCNGTGRVCSCGRD